VTLESEEHLSQKLATRRKGATHTHTHTRLTALCPGLLGWADTRKVKPIWILLKQETVSGNGISWAMCKSTPRSRQITTPAPHHSVFYRPDALPAAQPTASKHWRRQRYQLIIITKGKVLSWEYRSLQKRISCPPASVILCWVSSVENVLLIYYASGLFTLQICLFTLEKIPGLRRFWTGCYLWYIYCFVAVATRVVASRYMQSAAAKGPMKADRVSAV